MKSTEPYLSPEGMFEDEGVAKFNSTAVPFTVPESHVLAEFVPAVQGPTLVCVAGLHGNERMGLIALSNVVSQLESRTRVLRGRFLALAGNLTALRLGDRFVSQDLNRMWSADSVRRFQISSEDNSELLEMNAIFAVLEPILSHPVGEKYLVDLHTTSANGGPFTIFGDTLRNRDFAQEFHVTKILGLEELLEGLLVQYAADRGATSIGFEGGQHDDPDSIALHEAAIWVALVSSGVLKEADCPELKGAKELLGKASAGLPPVVEVRFRYPVQPSEEFSMKPGFLNFDPVHEEDVLAQNREGEIRSPEDGRILMPLYQKQGADGFFIVREVSSQWLRVSRFLRKLRLDKLVLSLPVVAQDPNQAFSVRIHSKYARWLTIDLFHLLGFRRRQALGDTLVFSRRKYDSRSPYRQT